MNLITPLIVERMDQIINELGRIATCLERIMPPIPEPQEARPPLDTPPKPATHSNTAFQELASHLGLTEDQQVERLRRQFDTNYWGY